MGHESATRQNASKWRPIKSKDFDPGGTGSTLGGTFGRVGFPRTICHAQRKSGFAFGEKHRKI